MGGARSEPTFLNPINSGLGSVQMEFGWSQGSTKTK